MTTVAVEAALSASPEDVGTELLAVVEDQWFDRKSAKTPAKTLAPAICGMANADGGILVIGLHDGSVEGTDSDPRRRNALVQASIDFCVPPVRVKHHLLGCVREDGVADHLLVLRVEASDTVHATVKDEVFLRVGDETRKLGFHQRQELFYDKGQASYEARVLPGASVDDVESGLINAYVDAVQAPDALRLLQARGLAVDRELTIAGCLLFARYPQGPLPETFVRVIRYRGRERGTGARQQMLNDERIEGPIPELLAGARRAIADRQPKRRALQDGRFADVPLVPEDAWLEGLVNAVVHRSYSVAGDHIRVEIFDDRIEISSPGRFPGLVDLTDPANATRFARNPRIARVCADLHFGQELGEGVRRMFEEMRQAGLVDPVYHQTSGSVQLTLSADPVDRALESRMPEHARAITRALRESGRLSTGELTERIGMSRPTAQRELAALRDAGIVEWIGKSTRDPRAYWQLKTT
ncbi:ATP-binding protein [Patulibacter americanus]|uniref:ATP-binding protein n=1 Tax=Patulibacter americanus TaxID=588672 RepID=UPI0003B66172|nr:ATP-binding protein [Patulibacter americanus]